MSLQTKPGIKREIYETLILKVIKETIPSKLINSETKILINSTGEFVKGGSYADSGLTGRKLQCDSYGGLALHGGGAWSGKDFSKVDRSASYYARYIAKNIVALKDDLMAYALEKITEEVNADNTIPEDDKSTEIQRRYAKTVPAAIDIAGNGFITFARQWGGKYTTLKEDLTGELLFHTDPNTFAAMEWLKNNNDAITLPNFWDQQYASTPFLAGQTFITIGSSAGIRYNDPEDSFELGAAPIPYNADKPEHRSVMQQGINISLMKTGTADEMLVSWLFLKHMINTQNISHWSMNTGYLPVRNSAYTSAEYQKFLNNPTNAQKLISLSANASYLQTEYMKYDPAFIGSSITRQQVGDALVRIVTGDGNIQAALDQAYEEATRDP